SIETELLGTAGAIKNAQKFIDSPFFMVFGDSYVDINFKGFLNFYIKNKADYLMLLSKSYPNMRGGAVVMNSEQKVIEFLEKPSQNQLKTLKTLYINAGVYLLSPNILDFIPENRKCSLEKEIFPKLINDKNSFFGYPNNGSLIDIGVPEGYHQFINKVRENNLKF
ncbi:MAG: hypothetical protein GY870_03160, partial [archaeon]|nr:hypothetical protein [archaeon]